jgi:Platelet-activating factor acetylhydrolase, isoform II
MRRLEIAGTVGLLLYTPHLFFSSADPEAIFAIVLCIAVLAIAGHVWFEGYRWQMAPAYLLACGLVLYECMHRLSGFHAPYLVAVAAVLCGLTAVLLCILLPVFRLPAPTGPYKVGTQTRHLVDESRSDPFSDRPGGRRELMIQIWYPAEASSRGQFAPYRERSITTFRSAHLALVKSHSILGAKVPQSPVRFPLLLYTPSWSGIRTESTAQVEELASHGYVVVGMDHPYSSDRVVFPDGTVVRRKFLGDEDYSSQAAVEAFVETASEQVKFRAEDARFVLDVLERLDENDPQELLTGRLDLARVGIFGSSLGGGTAAEVCSLDRRFKAGVDMGGMIAPKSAFVAGTDLSSFSSAKRREIEFSLTQFASMKRLLSRYGGYWMTIRGIKHIHFFDAPLFSPLRRGCVSPSRVVRIVRQYIVAFFDERLKGIEQPILEDPSSAVSGVCFQAWVGEGELGRSRHAPS